MTVHITGAGPSCQVLSRIQAAMPESESSPCQNQMPSNQSRREICTALPENTIWTPLDERSFRQTAVDLALATGECPWNADVGLPAINGVSRAGLVGSTFTPLYGESERLRYSIPQEVEHRLANDFAFICATQEAVFSVTAACVEEVVNTNRDLLGLTLRLAANEGISDGLKASLLQMWSILSQSTTLATKAAADQIFQEIIFLNRSRVLQRARKAVGHPPIFREKGRTRTNPDDRLLRALMRMQKSKLTVVGQRLVERGLEVNTALLRLLEDTGIDDLDSPTPDTLQRLRGISQQCFDVTTDCGRTPFKHILVESGLDAQLWLRSKYIGEVDKIGAYWRIANTLVEIYGWLHSQRPPSLGPIKLIIEGVDPYAAVMKEPSIQGRVMQCYVHAEMQMLCHYLVSHSQDDVDLPAAQQTTSPPPRVMGASKSACFLCYLCLSSYGGLRPPPTHGRLYDQWTLPDLAEYTPTQVSTLRQTLAQMDRVMGTLRSEYRLKRQRDHPMTSRVDIDKLVMFPSQSLAASDSISITEFQHYQRHHTDQEKAPKIPILLKSTKVETTNCTKPGEEHASTSPAQYGLQQIKELWQTARAMITRMSSHKRDSANLPP